ncbi:hypothetical protein H5410_021794, partial [Solanum commersonii]
MRRSTVYSNIQVVTHHYQRFLMLTILATNGSSSSTTISECLHTKNDFIFTQGGTQCMFSSIGLPLFSNQSSVQLAQDQKAVSKTCNGAECK